MSDELIDVEVLINAALKTKAKHDAEESAQITEKERRKELEKIVVHRFEEVKNAFSSIVNVFNKKSDDVILNQKLGQLTIDIYPSKYKDKHICVLVEIVCEHHNLNGKEILAWGHVKAPSGRGFNLILVCTNEDTYEWYILQVKYSFYYNGQHQKLEPFPFEIYELSSELKIHGAHIYEKSENLFKVEYIIPLLKEIL